MIADIECMVKQCAICLEYQQTQFQEKVLHYKIPCRSWEVVGEDVFAINNKTVLCIVDYDSKFTIVKKVNSLSADNLVQMTKMIFAEYGLLKKTVSGAGTNFTPKIFRHVCRQINIKQIVT